MLKLRAKLKLISLNRTLALILGNWFWDWLLKNRGGLGGVWDRIYMGFTEERSRTKKYKCEWSETTTGSGAFRNLILNVNYSRVLPTCKKSRNAS